MPETTDRYALPLLQAGQAQKEVTHNEALLRLDALAHLAVEARTLTSPPLSPSNGAAWIVAVGASGDWTGQSGKVACFHAGGWMFLQPVDGCLAWSKADGFFLIFRDGGWSAGEWPAASLRIGGDEVVGERLAAIPEPSGGATIDAEARTALAAILAAMRAHGLVETI